MDGKTERLNQTLKQYLRFFLNYKQDNWVKWLLIVILVYNGAFLETLGMSSFFINYGYEPTISYAIGTVESIVSRAEVQVDEFKNLYRELSIDIMFIRVRMAKYYNSKKTRGPVLKEGDKAYLL